MKILKKYANGGKTIQSKSDIRMGGSTHSVSKERRGKKKTFSRNTSMSTPKHLGGTGRTEKFYKTVEREGKEPKRKEISERKYLRKSKRYNKKLGRSKNITHSPSMEESAKAFPSRLPITRTGTFENGGTTGRVPGGQKDERQRARLRKRLSGGSSTGGRGGVKRMDSSGLKKMKEARRRRSIEKANPGGYKGRKMEFGGVGKEKPSRFERKFAKQRGKYDKDVKKGRTQEAPHERTFKFRPDGQSVFKKRKKYNVEHDHELRKRKRSERHEEDQRRYPKTEDTPPSRPPIKAPDTEDGSRRPRFENGGTTGRVPGGQKDERQRDRLRRRIAQKRRKVREGKKYPTGVKESTPAEMRERTKNSQPLPNEFKRRVDWREKKPRYKG